MNNLKKGLKLAGALAVKKLKLATLKIQLIVGGVLLLIVILLVMITGIISIIGGDSEEKETINADLPPGQANVSAEVMQYRDKVNKELSKYNLESHTDLVLALMMQESGGKGLDPMQASESYCGSVGCIIDPNTSIEKGVEHFKNVLKKANNDIRLTLQSYNFGGGFIDYANENGGKYTKKLAIKFSQKWYQKVKHTGNYSCLRDEAIQYNACYGDIMYVEAVMKYLPTTDDNKTADDTGKIKGDFKSPLKRDLIVNSPFKWRDIGAGKEHHNGIDFECSSPDSIHVVKDGEVMYAGKSSGYGNLVTVKHDENSYTSYAHMSKLNVKKGQKITGGNQVGICGTTGRSTGEHLHFEIKTELWGGHKDPAKYLGL